MRLGLAEFDSPCQPAFFNAVILSDQRSPTKLNQHTKRYLLFVCCLVRVVCLLAYATGRISEIRLDGWGRGQKSLGLDRTLGLRKLCRNSKGIYPIVGLRATTPTIARVPTASTDDWVRFSQQPGIAGQRLSRSRVPGGAPTSKRLVRFELRCANNIEVPDPARPTRRGGKGCIGASQLCGIFESGHTHAYCSDRFMIAAAAARMMKALSNLGHQHTKA